MVSIEAYLSKRLELEKQMVEIEKLNTFVNVFDKVQTSMSEKDRTFWRNLLRGKLIELMSEEFPQPMIKRFREMEL